MKRSVMVVLVLVVSSSASAALDAWWETFDDPTLDVYVERALEANHDIRIAHARVREARASRRAAAGGRYPDVAASGGATRLSGSENGFGPASDLAREGVGSLEGDVYDAGIEASWEIDLFGSVGSAIDAATARVEAADARRRDVELLVASEVALSYIELRGAERRLAFAEDNVRIQSDTLDLVRDRQTAGLSSELELVRARAQLRASEAQLPPLRAAIRLSLHRLAVLTARMPGDVESELLESSPSSLSLGVVPVDVPVGRPPELLLRRPDLRAAERELVATTFDVGVARADLYPRFFVRGALGLEATSPGDLASLASGTGLLGAFFRWPIFKRGEIRARIDLSNARAEVALARYEQAVLRAVEDVESALVGFSEEKNVLASLRLAREDAERSQELARSLYRLGLADFLAVLDAERRLRELDDALALSETRARARLVRLYESLGGGFS